MQGMSGHGFETRLVSEEISPLAMKTRCVDSNPISFELEFELGLEDVLVLLEVSVEEEVDQVDGPWEESCFLVFSKFMGFSVKGYEGEILAFNE